MSIPVILAIAIIIIIGAVFINRKCEGYLYDTTPYARLGSYGYSTPLFEPDILRRCASGSYTYTSNPDLTSFCSTVPPPVLDRVACARAYRGRPLRFEYTSPAYGTCNDDEIIGFTY